MKGKSFPRKFFLVEQILQGAGEYSEKFFKTTLVILLVQAVFLRNLFLHES